MTLRPAILLIALVAALAMTPVAPEAGNIIYLAAGAVAIILMRPSLAAFYRPIVWMPFGGLSLVLVAYTFAAGGVAGVLSVLYFAPFLAVWPLISLARADAGPEPAMVALLSLCGVAGAAAVAVGEFAATGTMRAGASVANPIHFADVALACGVLATIGAVYATGALRIIALSGPVFAAAAVLLSGTRGAVVAFVAMAFTALVLAVVLRAISRRHFVMALVAAMAIIAALALGAGQISGVQRVVNDVKDLMQSELPAGNSTNLRLQMYKGGLDAFVSSPVVGHGPFAYVAVAESSVGGSFEDAPHLHSDLANFAASAGILGVLAYFLLLLAPLAEVFQNRRVVPKGLIIVVASLTVGYLVMGLTNAMFGILSVTVFFSTICVVTGLLVERPARQVPADQLEVAERVG
ncbi:O-antigen ligase [Devosia ginsengisoli]|uniref:O-antigen ligase family protein n=1 Tax=Devosia ginsengisoli TaxID=400770 RepID=UPI0026F30590|nr:O-antigen ligase family protein [Devosia ginsengisoli]MCR6672066.1 O-antigen ligase family protein [Devosia ginsengisoli]